MSEELKPCPFCGGDFDLLGWLGNNGTRGPECKGCGSTTDAIPEASDVIDLSQARRLITQLRGQRDEVIEETAKILMAAKVSALAMSFKTIAGERDAWESACVAIMRAEVAIRALKGKA